MPQLKKMEISIFSYTSHHISCKFKAFYWQNHHDIYIFGDKNFLYSQKRTKFALRMGLRHASDPPKDNNKQYYKQLNFQQLCQTVRRRKDTRSLLTSVRRDWERIATRASKVEKLYFNLVSVRTKNRPWNEPSSKKGCMTRFVLFLLKNNLT